MSRSRVTRTTRETLFRHVATGFGTHVDPMPILSTTLAYFVTFFMQIALVLGPSVIDEVGHFTMIEGYNRRVRGA